MVKRYRCFSGSCHEYLGSRSACHTRSNKLVVRYPSPRFIHWRLASLISKSIPLPGHPKQYSAVRQGEHEYILSRYQFQVPRALGRDLRLPEPSRFSSPQRRARIQCNFVWRSTTSRPSSWSQETRVSSYIRGLRQRKPTFALQKPSSSTRRYCLKELT